MRVATTPVSILQNAGLTQIIFTTGETRLNIPKKYAEKGRVKRPAKVVESKDAQKYPVRFFKVVFLIFKNRSRSFQ